MTMDRLERTDAVARLWDHDPALFTEDPAVAARVSERMGWLGLGHSAGPLLETVGFLAHDARDEGSTDVVLLGMGGSSLAPLVMGRILDAPDGAPRLTVLDTSSPESVRRVMEAAAPATTLFVVASKSGSTIEPLSLYAVFRAWADDVLGRDAAGRHFVASTDPGSPLETLAGADGFRTVLSTPADVGGRYSALTAFGLLPAALAGGDVRALVQRATEMETECRLPASENPGAILAAWMGQAYLTGRDKLTLATSPGLESFGLWVEQLIAESTGKDGKGLVPVIEHDLAPPAGYGIDRMIVVLRWEDDGDLASWAQGLPGDVPVMEFTVSGPADIGAEFVRWEVATALLGSVMAINPFDEPNVTEAKEKTAAILQGVITPSEPTFSVGGTEVTYAVPSRLSAGVPDLESALHPHLATLKPKDYLALLVYAPDDPDLTAPLREAAKDLSRVTGNAACFQIGPRYLHSTGQLHKGGAARGVFVVVTSAEQPDIPVPGKDFTLADLIQAQALGDMVTLATHGRRVIRVHLPDLSQPSVEALADALRRAL